jgi:hypothetical protein
MAPSAILQDGYLAPFLNLNFPAPSAFFQNGEGRANFKPNLKAGICKPNSRLPPSFNMATRAPFFKFFKT